MQIMMMQFEFTTANRIVFGNGISDEVPRMAASLGNRALLITDLVERSAKMLSS